MNYNQAKKLINEKLKNENLLLDGTKQYKMFLMFKTGVEVETKDGRIMRASPIGVNLKWLIAYLEGKETPYKNLKFTGQNLDHLILLSKYDPIAWDAAKELINKLIAQDNKLPEQLHLFYISNIKRPTKRGLHRAKNLYRNQCIAECFYLLHACDYKPFTKSSSYSKSNSACHIISKSLSAIGIKISYDGIKSIWNEYKEFCIPFPV